MLRKSYSKKGSSCRVTFDLPAEVSASTVSLCGEFNEWDASAHRMKRAKHGGFSTRISLPSGQTYRFRYLLDGQRWENDWAADGYVPNSFGTEDSLLKV
jgi:1,4-alpha-glucan branching enzyme